MRTRFLSLAMLFVLFCAALQAQTPQQRRVVIVKDHGTVTVDGNAPIAIANGKVSCDNLTLLNNMGSLHRNPCKPFIGVGTNSDSEAGGLTVDYTVDNTPATKYGVAQGDIILAIDGIAVKTQSELVRQRDTHQPGDAFTLTIRRNGTESTLNLRFRECTEAEKKQQEQNQDVFQEFFGNTIVTEAKGEQRPILGVYEADEATGQGLTISEVIEGKGAAAAGLREGDVIIQVDGKPVAGTTTLRAALAGHQPGETVNVVFLRNGSNQQVAVKLSGSTNNVYTYTYKFERDPCAVFIGVYTADMANNGEGVRVVGVIDDTPAKESAVQVNDVILQLDGAPVNTHLELRRERDKHQPGDAFTLTVLRDGQEINIEARFKSCDKKSETFTAPTEEKVTFLPEAQPVQDVKTPNNSLDIMVFEAYPNPTYGLVNVRFEAEAVPTTVRMLDAAGRVVYNNVMDNFSGVFAEPIDLAGKTPGTYTLTVIQGKKVASKNIVLLPRA